ncbi:WD40 repeat domain-containing protein [Streptomyces mirabilis]|uniref:WD40 repeat domain-containing protein n=1 Tax=Streptomyces mirabilis TaxID=68239 RepID=UPI00352FDB82
MLPWDPTTGRPRHVLEGGGSAMWSVAVSRNGTTLVAVTMDGTAHLWDIGTAVEVCRLRVNGHLSACSFHPVRASRRPRRLGGPVRVRDLLRCGGRPVSTGPRS